MSRTQKIFFAVFLVAGLLFGGYTFFLLSQKAAANPSAVGQSGQGVLSTSSATGTPQFMTPGAATSTLTLDQINKVSTTSLRITRTDSIGQIGYDQSWLALQMTGSSSVSSFLDLTWEYSNDGVDFYRDIATSTNQRFAYSSTTPNGIGGQSVGNLPKYQGTGNITNAFLVEVPKLPARYIRAVLTVPAGSLNSTNWGQYFTRQER